VQEHREREGRRHSTVEMFFCFDSFSSLIITVIPKTYIFYILIPITYITHILSQERWHMNF
jgi:hypothetical protein